MRRSLISMFVLLLGIMFMIQVNLIQQNDAPAHEPSNPADLAPGIKVVFEHEYEFDGETIYTFSLEPQHNPRGTIALKLVSKGKSTTLSKIEFQQVSQKESLALRLTDNQAELTHKFDTGITKTITKTISIPETVDSLGGGAQYLEYQFSAGDPETAMICRFGFKKSPEGGYGFGHPQLRAIEESTKKQSDMIALALTFVIEEETH